MKRLIAIILAVLILSAFTACAGKDSTDDDQSADQTPDTITTTIQETVKAKVKIGFCLSGDSSFYQQLKKDIEEQCRALDYEPVITTAATAEEQSSQIYSMVSGGVSVIVLDPVNVDELETSLAECETQGIPVINVIEAINGIVSTLITPNYLAIGKSAGRDAVELYGSTEGRCLLIKTDYESFSMQLMTDGFYEEIDKDKDVTVYDEEYCGSDQEKAYEAAKTAIREGKVNFIFAQSDALAQGALRAVSELDSSVTLVAFGADMELIKAAADGTIHSCIFFGPKELAEQSVYIADRFVKNKAYLPPQYIELRIEAAKGTDAQKYYTEGALYAQTTGS